MDKWIKSLCRVPISVFSSKHGRLLDSGDPQQLIYNISFKTISMMHTDI